MALDMSAAAALMCDNKSGSEGAGNTARSLTHLLDSTERGLAMKATPEDLSVDARRVLITCLMSRSVRDDETGCLRWTGAHQPKGYGQLCVDGRARSVHRMSYELFVGSIPDGHEIDHVYERGCRYRDCIEPGHLEAVTHRENLRRVMAARTMCPNGHEYTPENTRWQRNHRVCRTCKRVNTRRYRQRLRELSRSEA